MAPKTPEILTPPGWCWDRYHACLAQQYHHYHHQELPIHTQHRYEGGDVIPLNPLYPNYPWYPCRSASHNPGGIIPNSIAEAIVGSHNDQNKIKKKREREAVVVSPEVKLTSSESMNASKRSKEKRPRRLLNVLLSLPIRQELTFVAIYLRRLSLDESWGLGLAHLSGDRILFSKVDLKPHVKTIWCRKMDYVAIKSHNIFTLSPLRSFKQNTQYPIKLLAALSPASTTIVTDTNNNQPELQQELEVGDLIVAIDGHSCMSSFETLEAVTAYMKNVQRVCLVVSRHPSVMVAAASTVTENLNQCLDHLQAEWTKLLQPPQKRRKLSVPPNSSLLLPHRPLLPPKLQEVRVMFRNPWFQQDDGQGLPYDDVNVIDFSRTSAKLFLPPINNFHDWLSRRKTAWKCKYTVYKHEGDGRKRITERDGYRTKSREFVEEICSVAIDFWTPQGFPSFNSWLTSRVTKWKLSYSWNMRTRRRIQQDCEEVVHVSCDPKQFEHWLNIRRRQWRLQRRKRQRLKSSKAPIDQAAKMENCSSADSRTLFSDQSRVGSLRAPATTRSLSSNDNEIVFIDEIIEAEEAEHRKRSKMKRVPIDMVKFFDSSNGIPDDIVVKCFEFLERKEHVKMLAINKIVSKFLQARQNVWISLCPSHWVLPRRPRKPWHLMYCSRLKVENEQHQKRWDDLLVKCAGILDASDSLCKIEKIVEDAEKSFGFDINYVSGVVCERNGLLNLAVIHKRHKVTRWLVDVKKADIETFDRGNFTPLLNAAWEGDRALVRYFLLRGSNRCVRGMQHYSKAIAPAGFHGLTADQWAEQRGHNEVAQLIRLGL